MEKKYVKVDFMSGNGKTNVEICNVSVVELSYVIGQLLKVIEENTNTTQEEIATKIIKANRVVYKK
jgi:hypothetical protein